MIIAFDSGLYIHNMIVDPRIVLLKNKMCDFSHCGLSFFSNNVTKHSVTNNR